VDTLSQHIDDIASYRLKITGLVDNPKSHTYEDVIDNYQHYKKVVTLDCVEGWSVTILWEGVLVRELMAESSPLPNAKVVIFRAYDGYTTSLALDLVSERRECIPSSLQGRHERREYYENLSFCL